VVYGQGTPALLSNCQLDVSAGVESVRCGDSATEGEAVDVLVPVRGVGGLARLELRWARLPGDWGLVGGIQGSYLSTGFSSAHQGSFAADPAQTGVPIVVDARLRTSSLGLLISLGAEKCF
jgi:hypothetical protein